MDKKDISVDELEKLNDKEIIKDLISEKNILCSYISKEQFNKLNSKLNM